MRKNLIWIILFLVFIISCTGSFGINKSRDPDNPNIVTYSTPRFSVDSEYKSQRFYTYLQFTCFKNNEMRTYTISSSYSAKTFPNLQKMIFFINGNKEEIMPDRQPVKEIQGVLGPTATITVQIPEYLIINLYEENNTLIRIVGNDLQYDIHFSDALKSKLRQFYEETI